jgi:hypothetical protein
VEASPELRRDEVDDLPLADAPGKSPGDEQGLASGGHTELLERITDRRDRLPARIALHAPEGQRRRLDHDGHAIRLRGE